MHARAALLLVALPASSAYSALAPLRAPARPAIAASTRGGLPGVTASLEQLPSQLLAAYETEEAIKAAEGTIGWWGTYIKTVEEGIFTLHDFFGSVGLADYAFGLTIFCFVFGVKIVTFPLNWKQLSSSSAMKALKPQQDLVRKWYGDNKDMLNMQTGSLFERYDVNPLAGCLPSLAQIPVFLGVYYSVTSIAKAKIYSEGFLWIPSLTGPIADRREGLSWLTEGWIDGVPRLGWEDTLAYLTIPVILVITQTVSLQLLGSFDALDESDDPTTKNTAVVLRFLPFMLGYFAMNAPAGLGLYWLFNNILTTAVTTTIKKVTEKPPVEFEIDLSTIGPRRDPVPLPDILSEEAFGNAAGQIVGNSNPEPEPEPA